MGDVMGTRIRIWAIVAVLAAAAIAIPSAAEAQQGDAAAKPVTILDTGSPWQMHHTLKAPVVQLDDQLLTVTVPQPWLNWATPDAPATWRGNEFDDSQWHCGPVGQQCQTSYLSRLRLRGHFKVTDVAKVGDLKFSMEFHGGAVVSVNGKEVARAHLPKGELTNDTLAEGYPRGAFIDAEGKLVPSGWRSGKHKAALALRPRKLQDVVIPKALLRQGVNVLAVEIVRAPYHKVVHELKGNDPDISKKDDAKTRGCEYYLSWNTCQLKSIRLEGPSDAAVVPNAARPKGVQVWSSNLLAGDFDADFGCTAGPPRPVRIVGVLGSAPSGKIVVGSSEAIRDLKVTPSDLAGDAGTIAAKNVRVRYAVPWGDEYDRGGYDYGGERRGYPSSATLLGRLLEAPLAEFPVRQKGITSGAVVPVWLTVDVPRDASAGTYRGTVTVKAEGLKPIAVAVTLDVAAWTLPDSQDFRTWIEIVQSPDSLAMEYGVNLWSDEHFRLIGKSFDYIRDVGSRVLHVPLIARTNYGNAESMVRWIAKADGTYEFDFSVMDRYLDVAVAHGGKPKIVAFDCWDIYLYRNVKPNRNAKVQEARKALQGKGPAVTLLDRKSGELRTERLPLLDDPKSAAIWTPLFAAIRQRMKARGLEETMMLGMLTDVWPTKGEAATLHDASGGLQWISHAHWSPTGRDRSSVHGLTTIGYETTVWHNKFPDDYTSGGLHGWRRKAIVGQYMRSKWFNPSAATVWRSLGEFNVAAGQRGVGRLGGEFWHAIRNRSGKRVGPVWARYPESSWRNLDVTTVLLSPAADGPVASSRLEMVRTGLIESEARIFIDEALQDEAKRARLGDDLAKRCQDLLNLRYACMKKGTSNLLLCERAAGYASNGNTSRGNMWAHHPAPNGHLWFIGSGWQERTWQLYRLAAEVAAKLNAG